MSLMATNLTLFFFLLLLSPLATSSPTPITITNPIEDDTKSAYEALADFNFPQGLLPKGALGYELDQSTGRFKAFLNGSCSFSLEGSYDLKYKSTISGYISQNKLTALTGISVKILFLWLNIIEVGRDGDDLYFSVGIASASFPIDNFYECPQCGCGLNCGSQQDLKLVWASSRSWSNRVRSVYILDELRCVGDANKFPSLRFRRTAFGMLVEETKNRAVKPVMTCSVSQ